MHNRYKNILATDEKQGVTDTGMTHTIAAAGKGGTGKTTVCGLIIDYLCRKKLGPVLAVDADANSNLNEVLGVKVDLTLGDIREQIAHADMDDSVIPAGMSKQTYADFKFGSAIIEEDDYDLLVMGRTQGQGCYCFVNGLLQAQIEKFADHYKYIVVDNEAGMEHISRGILPAIDTLLLVSDCSRRGIQAVGRIARLASDLGVCRGRVGLIVNKAPEGELDEGILEEIKLNSLELLGVVPQDKLVYEYDCAGKPTTALPDDAPVRLAVNKIMQDLGL